MNPVPEAPTDDGRAADLSQSPSYISTAREHKIDEFYKTVDSALDKAHIVILMGDFNAKIGVLERGEHMVLKQFGCGKRNERGQRLVDFALEHKLTIINTCFKKKPNKRWTWRSPNGKNKNEIDYILSNQPRIFHDIGTLNLNYPSDHRIIRAIVKLTSQKKSRVKFISRQINQLKSELEISNYKETLSTMLSKTSYHQKSTKVQTLYDNITNNIKCGSSIQFNITNI
nr:craniofacial development protein 2-like [Vanessa tameamea]